MPSAIVTGATGILGHEIVKELSKDKQTWPTIHALSRSKKQNFPDNVVHNHIDLQSSAEDMAKDLANVQGEYVFFTAYLAQDQEDKATKVNGDMLQNFIDALVITGAAKNIKRFILTTGCKQYGVHLGIPKNPMEETDKWLSDPERPPNFYYRQQEILHKAAKEHGWDWVVTYPNDVIGVAKGNFMNLASAVGLYAAVSKEMGKTELQWPGSPAFYTMFDSFTSAPHHARFNAWAAFAPGAANKAFNIVNGDPESWQNMWPKLAAKFGLRVPETMFTPEQLEGKDLEMNMPLMEKPPLSEFAPIMGLKNDPRVSQSHVQACIDLSKWAQKDETQQAWKSLQQREGLDEDAFEGATWMFLNFVLGRNFPLIISSERARKAGWTGYEPTWDSLATALDQLVGEKVLPQFDNKATHSS